MGTDDGRGGAGHVAWNVWGQGRCTQGFGRETRGKETTRKT